MKSSIQLLAQGTQADPGPQWNLWLTAESPEEKLGLDDLMRRLVTPRFIAAGFTHSGDDTALIQWPAQ